MSVYCSMKYDSNTRSHDQLSSTAFETGPIVENKNGYATKVGLRKELIKR